MKITKKKAWALALIATIGWTQTSVAYKYVVKNKTDGTVKGELKLKNCNNLRFEIKSGEKKKLKSGGCCITTGDDHKVQKISGTLSLAHSTVKCNKKI